MSAATLPDVFLPYQQRLMAAIDAHPVVVVEKSRRTGYSWAMGAVAMLTASAQRAAGGMDVLYMGYEKEMTREFIGYVADWAKSLDRAAGDVQEFVWTDPDRPEQSILAFRVNFASGFEVLALPSVPRALRGKQGLVILDEAAFHDDLPGVMKAAMALRIWGGKVVVISTHNGAMNPFNQLVIDIRAGARPYHLQRLTFEEALAEGLCERIFLTTGQAWSPEAAAAWKQSILDDYADNADEELHVIPNPTTGTFLPGPLIEARMAPGIPVLRWDREDAFGMWSEPMRRADCADWIAEHLAPVLALLDPETPHAFGFDCARRGDLSVIWVLEIGRDLVRRTPLVIELRRIPFAQQRQVLWHVLDRLPRRRGGMMDATGIGMQIAEETMQHYGASVLPVMMTEPWYRENMPALKGAFEDAMVVIPRDREIEGDMRAIKLVRGVARIPLMTKDQETRLQRHGDAAIALCLAYAATRAEPEEYGYRSAGRNAVEHRQQTVGRYTDERPDEWLEDNATAGRSIMPALRGTAFAA